MLFYPLDPGSRSGMIFFRIPDPEGTGMFFGDIFLNYLKNPYSFIFLLLRHAPETIRRKKKVGFFFIPLFMYSRIRDPG
jgi:hypothetical protein